MSARLSCMLFLLEECKREEDLEAKRHGSIVRSIHELTRKQDYIKTYRLSEELILQLEKDLIPLLPSERRKGGISHRIKILCALSFLANGSYQRILGRNISTYISQTSVSRAIHLVVNALCHPSIVRKYMRFPQNTAERQILKEKFFRKFKIPGVIGAIDGTFVAMVRPKMHEERYYCRKGYHARNVLIINDSELNILHVDATFGGATHDNFIFNNTVIKGHLEQLHQTGETVYLLGDSGYAQRPYMMTPFSNPEPGTPEEYYNNLQSSARNTAERTIGILKGRFRCLLVHRVLHYEPEMVSKIVIACSILHNICNRAGLPVPVLPATSQQEEARVLQMLHTDNSGAAAIDDLESGRLRRQQLVNSLWRARQ